MRPAMTFHIDAGVIKGGNLIVQRCMVDVHGAKMQPGDIVILRHAVEFHVERVEQGVPSTLLATIIVHRVKHEKVFDSHV